MPRQRLMGTNGEVSQNPTAEIVGFLTLGGRYRPYAALAAIGLRCIVYPS